MSIQLSGGMLKVPTRMKPRSLISFRRSDAIPETDTEASTIKLTRTWKYDRVKIRKPCIFVLPFLIITLTINSVAFECQDTGGNADATQVTMVGRECQ